MKKTKVKKDYQFFILLILCFWLFLCLIIIFSSGAYRKFSLLTDIKIDSKFPLSHSYLEERNLYDLNDYQYNSFRFSSDGQSFALIEKIDEKDCLIINKEILACYDKIEDLFFSENSQGFAYIARNDNKVKAVINGESSDLYDWIFPPYFFSDDARAFVFRARKGSQELVVVNNIESRYYDRILDIKQVKGKNSIVYYAIYDKNLWRGQINW